MTHSEHPPKIAYLAGHYPAVSHTFILREVLALKALGVTVAPYSIRSVGPEHLRGPDEKQAAAETVFIQQEARKIWPLLAAQSLIVSRPGAYLATLGLAWRTRTRGLRSLFYQLFYFAEATLLARHMNASGVTHLHSHFAQASTSVAMLAAKLAGIPYSFTLHGPADLDAPKDWHLAEKTAGARFVACISHYARSQVMRFADPAHWDKLEIIHCGVLPALYDRPAPPPHSGTRLIFVGRLSPVKGLRILLEALPAACAEIPDLHLTIIGDGEDRALLEKMAAPLGDAVTFTGYQSQQEVADALDGSDILVLPSFAEGVPVVLMEAMAAGKPVICTQVAGVGELVQHGVSGQIVPPGHKQALTDAIVELAQDPEKRQAMGRAGRAKVIAEFDIAGEAAKLAALFNAPQS